MKPAEFANSAEHLVRHSAEYGNSLWLRRFSTHAPSPLYPPANLVKGRGIKLSEENAKFRWVGSLQNKRAAGGKKTIIETA